MLVFLFHLQSDDLFVIQHAIVQHMVEDAMAQTRCMRPGRALSPRT